MLAIAVQVDPFPLLPATWIDLSRSCGRPSCSRKDSTAPCHV